MQRQSSSAALTAYEQGYIVGRYNESLIPPGPTISVAQLARNVGAHPSTVGRVLAADYTEPPAEGWREGLAASMEPLHLHLLVLAVQHPAWPPRALLAELRRAIPELPENFMSPATCLHHLRKHIPYQKAVRRPALTQQMMLDRLLFLAGPRMTMDDVDDIIWSDEAMLCFEGNVWRWISSDDLRYDAIRTGPLQKYMIWGAFSFRYGPLPCRTWPPGTQVTAELYRRDVLDGIVGPWLASLPPGSTFRWQQDNCRVHTTLPNRTWFGVRNINVLDWPPYSPDLSAAEFPWKIIKSIISSIAPSGRVPGEVEVGSTVGTHVSRILNSTWHLATTPDRLLQYKDDLYSNWEACINNGGGNHHQTA